MPKNPLVQLLQLVVCRWGFLVGGVFRVLGSLRSWPSDQPRERFNTAVKRVVRASKAWERPGLDIAANGILMGVAGCNVAPTWSSIMNANMQGSTAQVVDGAMQPVTTSPALLTGKIKIANDLYSVFANDEGESRKFAVIFDAAMNVKFTPEEMEANLKSAQAMADEADKRNGFSPAVGAKGTAKYGPKRQAMNVRSSEIRQLFGALLYTNLAATHTADGHEVTPKVTAASGFTPSVKLARQALKDQGINWDNTPVLTEAQRIHIQAAKLEGDVKAKWIAKNPQEEGESMRNYAERMEEALLIETAKALTDAQAEKVKAMAAAFIKKHGLDFAAEVAEAIIMQYNDSIIEEVVDPAKDQRIIEEGEAREIVLN